MKLPTPSRRGLRSLLLFFAFSAALWAVYYLCIYILFFNAVFWIYVGIFAVMAIVYVVSTRGMLFTPPSETPPPGCVPEEYEFLRQKILERQKKVAWIPLFCGAILFVFLLDAADLFWLSGRLTRQARQL